MIYLVLFLAVIGAILDIACLYISIMCTKNIKNFKLGKLAYKGMLLGESMEKLSLYLFILVLLKILFK